MVTAQSDDVIRLWPDGPPTTLEGVGPEVEVPRAGGRRRRRGDAAQCVGADAQRVSGPNGKPNGVGVIVCPGGGWRILAWEHEGLDVARWLTAHGYTAFLLKYRVRGTPAAQADYDAEMVQLYAHDRPDPQGQAPPSAPWARSCRHEIVPRRAREAAADDGRRAIAIVRERASEWDVDPAKVGMIGFSAGAFLVVDVAVDPRAAPLAFVAPIYGGETLGQARAGRRAAALHRASPRTTSCSTAWSRVSIPTGPTPGAPPSCTSTGAAHHGFGMVKQGVAVGPLDRPLPRLAHRPGICVSVQVGRQTPARPQGEVPA